MLSRLCVTGVESSAAALVVLSSAALFAADATPDFRRDIQPILAEYCYQCHGPDAATREADLRFDLKESALRSEDAVIVPGKSKESAVYQRITSAKDDEVMPPPAAKKKLTQKQIELLTAWIDGGAAWGRHWAYEAPVRAPLPQTSDAAWSKNAVDRFILFRLEQEKLRPAAEASKESLIRRVSLDLTGLPPTTSEIDAFLADTAPDAYEKLVDRLLASPRYGERMAWDWLDAARYADTNGFQGDPTRTMWPWRDWVVRAINENEPYDAFTVEQIAGDLIPNATKDQILATGFNRNHMHNGEGGRIAEETRIENVFDRAETTATVWMGLTFTCCRCHDHKFDPITQREYYQLFAYFNNSSESGVGRGGQTPPVLDLPTSEQTAKLAELQPQVAPLEKQLAALDAELRPKQPEWEQETLAKLEGLPENIALVLQTPTELRTDDQSKQLTEHYLKSVPARQEPQKSLEALRASIKGVEGAIVRVMVMDQLPNGRDSFMLVRGAYDKTGEKVTVGTPAALPALPTDAPANRLALARWLVSPEHPLTARVTVNRIWQQFFGMGLVKTVEDFGVQGERPSHPELLDWLALELQVGAGPAGKIPTGGAGGLGDASNAAPGWDVKRLHRLIVTSATYRQSSKASAELIDRDPENRLLARGPRFRMSSAMIRDQALAASGLLVERFGGPSVNPYQPPGIWEEATFGRQTYPQDHGDKLYRRSLYTFWKRIVGPTMFFDSATRQTCTVKQFRTNTPLHALATLNDTTYVEASRALAQQVMQTAGSSASDRVAAAFRRILSRAPSPRESEILAARYERLRQSFASDKEAAGKLLKVGESPRNEALDPTDHAALTALCSVLFNLDEAVTKQ